MTLDQVLHKFSRLQVTTSIGILALLASGGIELTAPKPAHRGMQFQPEKALAVEPVGAGAATFKAQQPRPTSLASADFDVDGVKDLAVGYGLNKGGEIAIMRGNLDAVAPQSKASWTNAAFGRSSDAFLPQANMIPVPVEPDQLIAADVNGDGHVDLVLAANNGNAIYILAGNGKGQFALQHPVAVQGAITALAAYKPGDKNAADALVVGVKTASGNAAELYRMEGGGIAPEAVYPMPGPITAITTANLDGDLTPDAAMIAGGQVAVLHGAGALAGKGRLETLPLSDAVSVATGSFLFDRHAGLQLAVLTSDGTAHFLAHEGFDPRPFTTQEITAARRNAMRRANGPTLAQIAGNNANAPWTEVETVGGVASAESGSAAPLLLRAHVAGSGQDDLIAVNGAQQEIAAVRHPASAAGALHAASGMVMRSPLSSGDVVAAIAQRVSPAGGEGIIFLRHGSLLPEISTPAQSNTMFVNTTSDSLDANDTARCTSGSGETCSLRDAITYANADASVNIAGGTSDTIMIPSGTYTLTYQAGVNDANNNAVTHLEILGPMTLVGDTSGGGVTISAQSNDVVFTINPGPYGSYNPSGDSYVFDTTLENLTITGGQNFNNPANSSTGMPNNVGGAINWDADGTGNLTLTNCNVDSNTNGWGDGGGIWFFNSAGGGSGTLTLSGGSVSSNQTSEVGGGIYQATTPAGFSATGVTFATNEAAPSVNTNDPGGASGADDAGAVFLSAVPGGSGTSSAVISGGSITGNSADGDGGGIYTTQGITITGATNISSNTATGSGGGIFHNADATTTVTGANIATNSATNTGGGITVGTELASNGNAFTIANSRIFGNTSTNGASGLSAGEPSSSGAGAVTATENWWGCNAGPTSAADGCDQAVLYDGSSGSLSAIPNIVLTLGVNPSTQTLGSPIQLDAAVNTDSSAGPVPGGPGALQGLSVAFTATVGAFSASPSASIDGAGNATTSVTPTSSGSGAATATLDNQTVTQNFTMSGTAPAITSANSTAFTAATAGSFTVTTTGTPTPALSEVGALPIGVIFVDNGDGTATIFGTATTAGSYPITITAQNGVTPAATQSFTLTVNAGAATYLVIPGGVEPFDTAFAVSIYAYDAYNNLATSYNGTVAFSSSDPGFVNMGPVTLANGAGTSSAVLKTAGVDTITATDTTNPSITGTGTFMVAPGAATHLSVVAPASTYAGAPISIAVTAYDLFNNVATSYGGTVAFTSTDPAAFLPSSSTLGNGTGTFTAYLETAGAQTITATDAANSLTATSGGISVTIPALVVTTAADDAGNASNCTIQTTPGTGTDIVCSLRDALLFAANQGSASITFDSTKFASATTILLTNGTLNLPANTTIIGPTSGSGASLKNLLTVDGGGAGNSVPVFTTSSSAFGAVIQNLIITDGGDGGVYNGYASLLTIQNCTISNNVSSAGTSGVFNDYNASLTITGSTISGNIGAYGAIVSEAGGTVSVSESTISGNISSNGGGGILSGGTSVTVSNSTITGNLAYSGGGILISGGALTLTDSIVAGNLVSNVDPDVDGAATDGGYNFIGDGSGLTGVTNGTNGDQVGTSVSPLNPMLASLGSFGGPTQTLVPLPGSPAICAISPSAATGTDQRGLPRTTTYNATTCQDIGAVETNYALSFTTEPDATENTGVSFPAALTLNESGNAISGVTIPVTLNGGGTLAGSPVSGTTNASGVASYTLTVSNPTPLTNLTLIATLPSPPSVTATSSDFALSGILPAVTGLSPTSGSPSGGTTVTIMGSKFTGATAVKFGAVSAASFTVASATSIVATSPAGTGTVDVTVTTSNGTSTTTVADQFTYFAVSVTASPISATADTAFNGAVASFSENAGDTAPLSAFTATIAWGDGTSSAGTITQPGGAGTVYGVTGSHTYTSQGSYTFTVSESSTQYGNASGQSTASVAPAPATHFVVTAPASASPGTAFNFTVTALDALNNTATGYSGTVHFTSTDPNAVLPADSTLTNGTGTFSATLKTLGNQAITATDTTTASITGTTGNISVTIPGFVVINTNDSGVGSLRAALVNAASAGSGNITFDPTAFTSAQTITLTSGTLNIPSNTTITGPTSGSGASLANLVTVSGNNASTVFAVSSGAINAAINNLIVTNGNATSGGGIANAGTLTVSNCVLNGNTSNAGYGGAIYTTGSGTLTVNDSTLFGNSANGGYGGAISSSNALLTVSNSTFSGNSATGGFGGAIYMQNALMLTGSTISGNSATTGFGGGVYGGTATVANSIVSGNTAGTDADTDFAYTNNGGNLIGVSALDLAPLGNYGGPTPTMIPLPGSPAICAGVAANILSGVTTDQRGEPNTNTIYPGYSSATPCVDSGAVQTSYSLAFSAEPPNTVTAATNFDAGVTLSESGSPFVVTATPSPTVTIPLTLNGTGTLTGGSAAINDATGIATYSSLRVSQVGSHTLTANLTLNTIPTTLSISATSSSFTVGTAATTTTASSATATYSATTQNVTLSATVTSTAGSVNAGAVTFTVLQGATPIGTAATGSVSNGSASVSYTLPAGTSGGTYTIQATYNGTASFATSTDNTHTLTIGLASTTTAASNATVAFSASAQSVTLAATVTSNSGVVDAGTVAFTILQGATPIGTAVTSATVNNGAASVSYTLPAGTAAGTYTIQAVYSGTVSLQSSSDTAHSLTIGKATATVKLGNLTQTYTGSQLSATATTVPAGLTVQFTYNGSANQPTTAGSYTVVGTISDANYQGSATGTLKINRAAPSISWAAPAAITYGTALSTTQLDATASFNSATVAGNFAYTPPAGTVPNAGTQTLSVTFTPSDTTDLTSATSSVQIKVNQATPSISWPAPAAITYGTALGATQLDATASYNSATVAGTFVYSPTAGTVLSTGPHTLSVTFTPTDTADYSTPGPATTTITVNSATLDVTANNATKVYGTANPVFAGSVTGAQNSDSFTESFATTATTSSNVGSYPIVPSVTGADLSDYTQAVTDGTLTITQAASSISLNASATSVNPGEPLTLTATVASSTTGTPTGTVTFFDNTIPLGTVTLKNGTASIVTSALAPGISHSISATYSGDTNFTGSSTTSSLKVTVTPLEFTLTVNGATLKSVYPGGTVNYTFNVSPEYGSYAGAMNFTISGLPSGVTATFSPNTIPANGGAQTVTLTISDAALSSAANPQTGIQKRMIPIGLALLLLPLFGARRMRRQGRKMRQMFLVLVLACSALSATLLSGCSSPNGFFAQPIKDYNLTITATAGPVQKSATVTLEVQ